MFYVYRLLNQKEDIIYIGYTKNFKQRLATHRRQRPWYKREVCSIQIWEFDTKITAMAIESEWIKKFNPIYNSLPGPNPMNPPNWWALR